MGKRLRALAIAWLAAATWLTAASAQGQGYTAEQELVDRSLITYNRLLNDPELQLLRDIMADAKAVMIAPELLRAGLIFGAEGGDAVLLARAPNGSWTYPTFYTLGAGSVGLQIGAEFSEAIFVIMTNEALAAVISDQAKFGLDVSGSIGPIGIGLEASTTTNLDKDIYAFARSAGLFAGGALEGAVFVRRDDMNETYYGIGATADSIIYDGRFQNVGADPLRGAMQVFSGN